MVQHAFMRQLEICDVIGTERVGAVAALRRTGMLGEEQEVVPPSAGICE